MTVPFSKPIKRAALTRAGGRCEAAGAMYGLSAERCGASLAYGVEFDHVILHANSRDNRLENCAAVCIRCHKWKSAHHDTPMAAKTVRQSDKHFGIRPPRKVPMMGSRKSKFKKHLDGRVTLR